MTNFSALLTRCRKEAGYDSGRGFYKKAGGRAAFRCTYQQYLNIETGRSVPKPAVFYAIIVALGVWKDQDRSGALCRAYLEAQYGGGEFMAFLLRSLGQAGQNAGSQAAPLRKALQRGRQSRLAPLSQEQSRLIKKDAVHYWTYHVLAGDSGYWQADKIAALFGFKTAEVKKALTALTAAKVAASDKEGYWSPYRDRHVTHEKQAGSPRPEVAPSMDRLKKIWDVVGQKDGQPLFHRYLFLRASESQLRAYYPYFAMTMDGLEIYDTVEKGDDTSFVVVEATVRRMKKF